MSLYALQPPLPTDPGWSKLQGDYGAIRAAQARAKRLRTSVTVVRLDDDAIRNVYRANPPAQPLKFRGK